MPDERSFSHLVVVGSSAGGVEALSELVSTLPEGFPAPVIAVQHLAPRRESHLEQLLTRRSTLPVRTLKEEQSLPLESGVVFVVPADRHVSITDSDINLQEDTHGRPKPSIDLLFSSAAEMYGDRLVAVVLTDTGSDGTDGARAIKKAGGTVIIQNPDTAAHPGMPRSLAPSAVDIIADLDKIGSIIYDLLRRIEVPAEPDKQRKLREFLEEVRDTNGIDFRSYKTPTIMRRLQHWIVGAPVTMHDNPRLVREFLGRGASAYLVKSSSLQELVAAVHNAAESPAAAYDENVVVVLPREIFEQAERATTEGGLSARELEILLLVTRGLSNRQVSRALRVAETTVKRHLANLYPKMGVGSRGKATGKALSEGWISTRDVTREGR